MKRTLSKLLMLSLFLGVVLIVQHQDVEADFQQPAAKMSLGQPTFQQPPAPAFYPGSDSGGAGRGQSPRASGPTSSVEIHEALCCDVGGACDCVYGWRLSSCHWPGCAQGGPPC